MTVLTSPSINGKPDKEPLNGNEKDHHGQTQPPPTYHPKFLETGDGGLPNTKKKILGVCSGNIKCIHQTVEYRGLMIKMCKMTAIMLLFLLVLYFAIDTICKSYVQEIQKQQDTKDDAAVPCKSYTSYADAESDMILRPENYPSTSRNMNFTTENPAALKNVSDFTIKDSALFFHDFATNITSIVDSESHHCYIMPLLRTNFKEPESLDDMLHKMSTGYYAVDISHILSNFHLVLPAIANISDYASYIARDCVGYPTYELERDIPMDYP